MQATDSFKTKFHRDGSVTIWDVYQQQWVRTSRPTNQQLATLPKRDRILKHIAK
jgi:hypothetical protein